MLPECLRHARLAEACRRRQENELAVAVLRVVPAALQQAISSARPTNGVRPFDDPAIEASPRSAFTGDAPQPRRIRDALEVRAARAPRSRRRRRRDDGSIPAPPRNREMRQPESLRPGSMSRRRRRVPARAPSPINSPTTTKPVAMPTLTCGRTGHRQPHRGHRVDQRKSGADGPLCVVLVRFRIAEIDERLHRPCTWQRSRRSAARSRRHTFDTPR